MSRSNEASDTYFYSQKNERTFHRRLRKSFDDYTLFGEHKEQLLTFAGLGGSEGKESINRFKRPTSSYKRVVVSLSSGLVLPSVDPAGPKLVAEVGGGRGERDREDDDEDGASEAAIDRAEGEAEEEERRRKGRVFTFAEAKFASTSVLANLARLLGGRSDSLTIPAYLADDLLRNFDQLACDTVVERREWQTESSCLYPDSNNASPYLTGQPGDEPDRVRQNSSVEAVLVRAQASHRQLSQQHNKKRQRKKKKRINKNKMEKQSSSSTQEPLSPNRRHIPERPMTAMSVASNYSVRSDASRASSGQHAGRDESPSGHYEYDSLPAELRGTSPTILNYRREVNTVGPKLTRLEKLNAQKGSNLKTKRSRKISITTGEKVEVKKSEEILTEEPSNEANDSSAVKHVPSSSGGTLCFSISTCENEEWVVRPSERDDMEASTLHQWDGQLTRLKEAMRKREEAQITARLRGEDGPVIIKFYDPKSLRSKHQSFPFPSVLTKLPPSVASFSPPTPNETLMIGEGAKLFLLILPDGSGHCNYFSGREAVSVSRREQVRKGLHTVAYDDTEQHRMLGCFGPDGRNCCYYPSSGSIQMLTSECGGSLFDEDGHVVRNWTWPDLKYKLPVSVSIQLNSCMSFHCTGLANMVLRFSCHGQMNRFDVSPVLDVMEEGLQRRPISIHGTTPLVHSKSNTKPQTPSLGEVNSSIAVWNNNEVIKDLTTYKDKIKSVVDSWMAHYRQTIGITAPSPTFLSSRIFTSQTQSKSALGFIPGGDSDERSLSRVSTRSGHAHHHTHPLSSHASSVLGVRVKSPTEEDREEGKGRAISPTIPRPVSPLDYLQYLPHPQVEKRVCQVKVSKTGRPKRIICGCPVALHNQLLKGLDAMPPCKCDKRKAPYICDLELDLFVQSHVPKEQLIVVMVLSSVVKDSCSYEPMLDDIHYSMNKLRYSPCVQSSTDPYRLFKYDLARSTRDLTYNVPLLVQRHCVSSGMCLMYLAGELVYADSMFNGYGTTKTDFMKQVQHSMDAGRKEMFLPRDFRFSHRTGGKLVSSKLWAYPVTGVIEDLIPFTPESHSETNLPPIAVVQEPSHVSKNRLSMDVLQLSISKCTNISESAISVIAEDVT